MGVLFEKMAMLIILIILGYIIARTKLVGPEFNKGLSKLIINFFLVGMILSAVVNKDMSLSPEETLSGFAMMLLMCLICIVIALISSRFFKKGGGDVAMYTLLIAFSNNGFFGFPVVQALYGDTALFFASLSNIPFNILFYTFGVYMLSGGGKTKLKLKQIFTTPLIATLLAVVIFSFKIPMPFLVEDILGTVGSATVPLSMLCIGLSLGSVAVKDVFTKPKFYVLSFIKLIICPLLVWFVLHFFITDTVILGTIVVIAACPSALLCTIMGIQYGRDGVESSEMIFICTLLSVLSLPILMKLLNLA